MKKINLIWLVIGTISFLIAGYIVYDNFIKCEEVIINKEEEISAINNRKMKMIEKLGMID